MEIATDSVARTKRRRDNMKRLHSLFTAALAGVLVGLSSAAFAEHQNSSTTKDWRWEQSELLSPYAPGTRWVYALSGKQYANERELQVEVKGQQHVPHLKQLVSFHVGSNSHYREWYFSYRRPSSRMMMS